MSITFKDLAIELAVLVGLFFCMLIFFPAIIYPYSYEPIPALPLIGFIVLLVYSGFHLKSLLKKGKITHVIAFATVMMVTIIIALITVWIMAEPLLL